MNPDMTQYGLAGPPSTSLVELGVYLFLILVAVLGLLTTMAIASLPIFFAALGVMEVVLKGVQNLPDPIGKYAKLGGLVFRSLRRNLLRTALTYVALFVLTGMLTLMYGIVNTIGKLTEDKAGSQMVIMTEKFGIPSMMPPGYVSQVEGLMEKLPPEHRPADIKKSVMTWSFVGASIDPNKTANKENVLFLFAIDPDVVTNGMMAEQGLTKDDLGDDDWAKLEQVIKIAKEDKRNIVMGADRLEVIGKKVGDEIRLYSTNYKEIEFDCRIVGAFPSGSRMGNAGVMRADYLQSKLDDYRARKGQDHPAAARSTNLIWVRMPSKVAYEQLAAVVNDPKTFTPVAVKMETFSAAIGSFLEPFKDIYWGLRYIVMPAVVAIMCLVIGITITIGVRERWTEMAVMKVLGFQPWQVMGMIVSEAMLIGVYGGLLSTWSVYFLPMAARSITKAVGVKIAFFEQFKSPMEIVIYGPLLGLLVGLLGAALPSWNARKVKVSEVFAQVA